MYTRVRVPVCTHECARLSVHRSVPACLYTRVCTPVCPLVNVCSIHMYVFVHMYAFVHMYVFIHMYVFVHIYVFVHMYVFIYMRHCSLKAICIEINAAIIFLIKEAASRTYDR